MMDRPISHPTFLREKKQGLYNYLSMDLTSAFHKNILFHFKYAVFSRNSITLLIKGRIYFIQNFKSFYTPQKSGQFQECPSY